MGELFGLAQRRDEIIPGFHLNPQLTANNVRAKLYLRNMAVKHKNLYLFLTLACFLGIVLIFVFDGYMGVYDSLVMNNGQFPQTITSDQWDQQEKFGYLAQGVVDRVRRID